LGTIFAHDAKQFARWRNRSTRKAHREPGLTGLALEAAVRRVASLFPDNVIVGATP
jgi:hypothetical protein